MVPAKAGKARGSGGSFRIPGWFGLGLFSGSTIIQGHTGKEMTALCFLSQTTVLGPERLPEGCFALCVRVQGRGQRGGKSGLVCRGGHSRNARSLDSPGGVESEKECLHLWVPCASALGEACAPPVVNQPTAKHQHVGGAGHAAVPCSGRI